MLRSAAVATALSVALLGAGALPATATPRSPSRAAPPSVVVRTDGARAFAGEWRRAAARTTAAAGQPAPALWALTADTAEVVRYGVDANGDLVRTVLADLGYAVHLEVDPRGTVWVQDLQAGQLYSIAPDGTRTAVRAMTPYRSGFALDPRGDVFLYDVEQGAVQRVVRIDAGTGRRTLLGTLTRIQAIAADAFGHALVAFDDPTTDQSDSALARYPVGGGLPTVRRLAGSEVVQMEATPYGDVLFEVDPHSAAGADTLLRYDHVSGTVGDPTTKTSTYGWGLDPDGRLFLMQQRSWCAAPFLPAECSPPRDTSVDTVLVSPPGGGSYRRTIPVSGVAAPPSVLSVDGHGSMAFAVGGLKVLLPWGGPASTVASGSYFSPVLRG